LGVEGGHFGPEAQDLRGCHCQDIFC